LKTLEEPPPRVIFIFATTELIKIPETILSRCQCFEFKPLSNAQITKQLELICGQEEIQIDTKGLVEISKVGAGSMRDAQSLLDQVIAYSGKKIDTDSVESVLGIVGGTTLELFAELLKKREPAELIALVQEVANQGKDLGLFCRSMMEYLRNLLMVKVSRNPENLLNTHTCDLSVLKKQAEGFNADELQQMFTILSCAETEMKRSSLGQMVFEMAILRLTETRSFKSIDDLIHKINKAEVEVQPARLAVPTPVAPVLQSDSGASSAKSAPPVAQPAQPENGSFDSTTWTKIRHEVSRKRPAFEHYLDKCQVLALNEKEIQLMYSDSFTLEMVEGPENIKFIKEMVKLASGNEVQVILKLGEAKPSPSLNTPEKKNLNEESQGRQKTESEIIQDALDIFGGTVVK
jgi:DNA polymerase-3 subunit gamma/tau